MMTFIITVKVLMCVCIRISIIIFDVILHINLLYLSVYVPPIFPPCGPWPPLQYFAIYWSWFPVSQSVMQFWPSCLETSSTPTSLSTLFSVPLILIHFNSHLLFFYFACMHIHHFPFWCTLLHKDNMPILLYTLAADSQVNDMAQVLRDNETHALARE